MEKQTDNAMSGTRAGWAGALVLLAFPVLLLGDTVLALIGGWRPQSRLDLAIICAACAATILLTAAFSVRRVRRWANQHRITGRFGLSAVAMAIGLCVGEIVLLTAFDSPVEFHTRGPNLRIVHTPDPLLMPGMQGHTTYTTNSLGIRGPELQESDAFRILCVGGSTTECNHLDDQDTWYSLLMRRLNEGADTQPVWVGGVGICGFTTQDHLRFFRESPLLKQIDLVVALVGINDFQWFLEPPPQQWEEGAPPLWTRSAILERTRIVIRRMLKRPKVVSGDPIGEFYAERRVRRRGMRIVDELPPLSDALEAYAQRIRLLASLAKSREIQLVLVTQPVMWRDNLPASATDLLWFGWLDDEECLSPGRLRAGMDRFNDVLRSTCDEISVPYIDLESLSGRVELFLDDCHFNRTGAQAVAQLVSDWFLTHRTDDGRWVLP